MYLVCYNNCNNISHYDLVGSIEKKWMKVLAQKFALKSSTDKNIKLNFNRLIWNIKCWCNHYNNNNNNPNKSRNKT